MTSSIRVAVIGLTGCGKSTFATVVREFAATRGLRCATVKLAKPLYDLQEHIYRLAGVALRPGDQDQLLMEALASALRRIRPTFLADDFLVRLGTVDADVVLNDDLRDPHVDAPTLRRHGFAIVRVTADPRVRAARLAQRGDLTVSDRSTTELGLIQPDHTIDNSGDLADYRVRIGQILESWL